jgi:hypothetical protein
MPHFFFNYTSGGVNCVDDIGTEFPSLEAAYLDACEAALALAFEKLRGRQDPTNDAFEIVDEKQNLLMHLPFSEVLQPGATNISTISQRIILTLENSRRQATRNQELKDELYAELARARKMFNSIRATLRAF